MKEAELLEEYEKALSIIGDRLNAALIQLLREGADWRNHAGSNIPPSEYQNKPNYIFRIWDAREVAYSSFKRGDRHEG